MLFFVDTEISNMAKFLKFPELLKFLKNFGEFCNAAIARNGGIRDSMCKRAHQFRD